MRTLLISFLPWIIMIIPAVIVVIDAKRLRASTGEIVGYFFLAFFLNIIGVLVYLFIRSSIKRVYELSIATEKLQNDLMDGEVIKYIDVINKGSIPNRPEVRNMLRAGYNLIFPNNYISKEVKERLTVVMLSKGINIASSDTVNSNTNFAQQLYQTRERNSEVSATYVNTTHKEGILENYEPVNRFGGWLILAAIGMVTNPFNFLKNIYSLVSNYSVQAFSKLTGSNSLLVPAINIELTFYIIFFIVSIIMLITFFKKKSIFPRLYITFALSYIGFLIIDIVLCSSIPLLSKEMPSITGSAIGQIIGLLIWIAYFKKSNRVKRTFIN